MKLNGTSSNTPSIKEITDLRALAIDEIGDEHLSTSYETPLREDAFEMDDELKMELIEKHFREIMHIMGLDLTDDSLKGTPRRVAKMYVQEIFSGLNPANKPKVALFDNKYKYNEMLVEKDITFYSNCEHHFVPIIGKAHVAYISSGKVIGLSKINRVVQYFARRPQVQERLTVQIANELKICCKPKTWPYCSTPSTCACRRGRQRRCQQHHHGPLQRQVQRRKARARSFLNTCSWAAKPKPLHSAYRKGDLPKVSFFLCPAFELRHHLLAYHADEPALAGEYLLPNTHNARF
jgi:GTP cyclohydrolase I